MARLSRVALLLAGAAIAAAFAIVWLQYPYICLLLIGVSAWRRARAWRGSGSAFGTARLATTFDLVKAGMLGGSDGLILGRASITAPPTRWQALRGLISPAVDSASAVRMFFAAFWGRCDRGLIRVRSYVNLLTVAPVGAGKSIAVLVINLLSYRGACVVVDPKGELFKLSAWVRKHVFGHRIIRLDPTGLVGPAETSDGLNPFDFINEQALDFIDECRALADMLVLIKGTEPDPHWNARAMDILTAFIAFTCACEGDQAKRNLTLVRDMLASPVSYREVIRTMQQIPAFNGVLTLMGDKLTWLTGRERGGVLSTVSRHIGWLDSPAISASIARSTFDPRWLWSGKVTVYIILPSDKLTTLAPLMRLWLGAMLKLVSRNGASEKHPVLFLIDEAAHIGKLQPLEEAVTLLRGYGIRIWLFFQSLDQLRKTYGESASVILDNMGTQQFFGINSLDTADHQSKRLGDATMLVESINRSISRSRPESSLSRGQQDGNITTSESITISEQGRRLIRPEELLLIPADLALIFHKNLPPIAAWLVKYFEAPEFAKGRTGQGRRLGLPAVLASLLAVPVGIALMGIAAFLPSPDDLRRGLVTPASRPVPQAYGQVPAGQSPRVGPVRPGVSFPQQPDERINGRCVFCQAPMRLGNRRYENVRCRACGEIQGASRARIRPGP